MPKYEAKTKPTAVSVKQFLAGVDSAKRADSDTLIEIMRRVTGEEPKMWGPSIVGFGSYHYEYASGHSGDSCLCGFSPRKTAFSLYVMRGPESRSEDLAKLGKHEAGKGCLYVKRLADIDLGVLERLIAASVAHLRRTYPPGLAAVKPAKRR